MLIKLLYISYVVFFACLMLTNDFFLAYHSFLFVTVPLALVPIELDGEWNYGRLTLPRIIPSWSNPIQTISSAWSWVFLWTMMFGAFLIFSTAFIPNFSAAWLSALLSYLISIALFVLITARLANYITDFYGSFFTILSLIMSFNANVNIFDYMQALPSVDSFAEVRLTPDFGVAPIHFPTVAAMTYATGLVAAGGLFSLETCWVRKWIAGVSALVLFTSISLTQSRGPLIGSLVALSVVFYFSMTGAIRQYLLAAPLFLILSFLLIPKVGAFALARADNHRFEVWKRFLELALYRPVFGYGERLEVHLYISDGENLGHAHNIFLSALMRGGIFGVISLVFSYAFSVIYTYKFARFFNNSLPLGLITVILIAGLVDFDQIIFLADWQWVSFWMPLGLAVAVERRTRMQNKSLRETLNFRLWRTY
jgi:O-antigen ligase